MMRTFIFLVSLGFTACGQSDSGNLDAMAGDACVEGDWWCVDAGAAGTDGNTASGKDVGSGKGGDADKGDAKGNDGEVDSWFVVIDTTAGTGTFSYEKSTASGENCSLSYPVLEGMSLDSCQACSLAWQLNLGEVDIGTDAGGCGALSSIGNTTLRFGQGETPLFEYLGVTYYTLYESDDGTAWSKADGGYSFTDNEIWTFGEKK